MNGRNLIMLSLKFYNKRDNTPIEFQSIEYKITNTK